MKVKSCKCEECHYNKDFKCEAASIEVMSVGDKKVNSADGTFCSTFKVKS